MLWLVISVHRRVALSRIEPFVVLILLILSGPLLFGAKDHVRLSTEVIARNVS
jgi:hypothetical protein